MHNLEEVGSLRIVKVKLQRKATYRPSGNAALR